VQISVSVNGVEYTRDVEPRLLLAHFQRDTLRLTGTHWAVTHPTAAPAWC
jgi:carbon-monoxide dehydrogenase small subunit